VKRLALLLLLLSFSFASYQLYIVRANDTATTNLVYDDNSTSYADNSLGNPDALLRICALTAAELQGKYVSLMYADGLNPGDYIEITHFPVHITYVPPNNCVYVPLDIHSFRAWYASIPFVFISDSPDMSGATRQKLLPSRGWLVGNYTVTSSRAGNLVNITVATALDDNNASITPDVNYLVVGLVMDRFLTTTDTAITSPNDPVVLSLGSYTGIYYIHVNGIGPGVFAPIVDIISPAPTFYNVTSLPFVYTIMESQAPLDSCWYVLDGTTVPMPDCTISYILSVAPGVHTLFLYANDTEGNIGYDSVIFTVGGAVRPSEPTGGPGAPHVGQPFPVIPPSYDQFDINPENIRITIDYPLPGEANFSLYSKNDLVDVYCFVTGDFAEYTTVELVSDTISAGGRIQGTIIVDMPPDVILDYDKKTEGLMQCVGRRESNSSLILSTTANVYLTINRPLIEVSNATIVFTALDIIMGEEKPGVLDLTNIGNGSAFTYNMTAVLGGPYAGLIRITGLPSTIMNGETQQLHFLVSVPEGFEPGIYRIPVLIYENGRLMGTGYITISIKEPIGVTLCLFPDLRWTVAILIIGVCLAGWLFKREKEKLEKEEKIRRPNRASEKMDARKEKMDKWKPHKYAATAFLASLLLWAIIIWLLARCTYVTI